MATHFSFLLEEYPWTEEPGGSIGSQRVRHDWSDSMLANGLPIWVLPLTCFVSFADYLDSCASSVKQRSGQEDVCFHSDAVLWFLPPLQLLYHLSQFWFWKRISVTFTIWSFLCTHWGGFSVLPWSIRVLGVARTAHSSTQVPRKILFGVLTFSLFLDLPPGSSL